MIAGGLHGIHLDTAFPSKLVIFPFCCISQTPKFSKYTLFTFIIRFIILSTVWMKNYYEGAKVSPSYRFVGLPLSPLIKVLSGHPP